VDQKPGRTLPSAAISKIMREKGFAMDFCCIQGAVALTDSGPSDGGFVCYEGSHKLHREFFKNKIASDSTFKISKDWYKFELVEMRHYNKCPRVKPEVEAGSVILWDSRTVHHNEAPTTPTVRMAVYVCYQPVALADKKALEKKKEAFNNLRMTVCFFFVMFFMIYLVTLACNECEIVSSNPSYLWK
jgi:hypothetical protein